MKITKLEYFSVRPRWLFLKVHTDAGITGLGEPIVEGRARTVMTAVQELEAHLVGQDPRNIEHLWQAMYRGTFYRGGPVLTSAISGIEQACWDIFGKSVGLPVYRLLGGPTRQRIRMYRGCGGRTPGEAAASVRQAVAEGFTALKTGVPAPMRIVDTPEMVDRVVASFAAMREAAGRAVDLAIDFHGRVSPAMAVRLARALEPYSPLFIEEPCLPENVDTMVTVARSTSIPIATGERLYTKWGFREVLEKQAAAILQPDLSHAGGILECKKIAAMAETYFAAVAPHCPLGPIALASCLHLDASIPNFLVQEHTPPALGQGYLTEPLVLKDGYIELPQQPGLGIVLDEAALEDKVVEPAWDTPRLFHTDDGSVADW
jgi:galactonate dehydratase